MGIVVGTKSKEKYLPFREKWTISFKGPTIRLRAGISTEKWKPECSGDISLKLLKKTTVIQDIYIQQKIFFKIKVKIFPEKKIKRIHQSQSLIKGNKKRNSLGFYI